MKGKLAVMEAELVFDALARVEERAGTESFVSCVQSSSVICFQILCHTGSCQEVIRMNKAEYIDR